MHNKNLAPNCFYGHHKLITRAKNELGVSRGVEAVRCLPNQTRMLPIQFEVTRALVYPCFELVIHFLFTIKTLKSDNKFTNRQKLSSASRLKRLLITHLFGTEMR